MDARLVVPNDSAPTHLWDNKRGLRSRSHSASSDVSPSISSLVVFQVYAFLSQQYFIMRKELITKS